MADGTQQGFNFPRKALVSALRPGEIVVDFFAGGGGASEALRQALGRDPDVAVNHDHLAIGMHAANHPFTRHMEADVWTVDILREVAGRPVGWFHASPDCTHFSQAKGGQPRDRATRSLSWVIPKVIGKLARHGLAPRIFSMENVKQIQKWGPLVAKRDNATGRVVKLDGSVASRGERVPLREQFLVPDKRHEGRTWRQFVARIRSLGCAFEWLELRACDYGAGTSRTRLFGLGRRAGEPIIWPEPTHGPGRAHPFVTAADCIDFTIPCPSIFTRKKPLADATMRRIAKGVKRYVIDAAEPFIVPLQPLGTIVGGGVKHAIAAAHLVKFRGDSKGVPADVPMPTITSGAGAKRPAGAAHAMGVITAFLEQANGGYYNGDGHDLRKPVPTITGTGSQSRLATAHLAKLRGTSSAADVADPLHTISAGGEHHAVVECTLSPEHEAGALRVAAFLVNYYGNGQALDLREPLDTITTRDRLALVTVLVHGTPYVIVDIGLRMLRREELFRAQGFPADYIIDTTADGRKLSISASVRMVGNSVSPPPLCALARANLDSADVLERMAA
jgi:DNA (cytosine-5)-methyltransferase 1